MGGQTGKLYLWATLLALVLPSSATSYDLKFDFVTERESLEETLKRASLLEAARDEAKDARDIIATANAEYAALLYALYAKGHYGGAISIRADGREVADIAPLDVPSEVRNIVVRVEAGPRFRFSDARIEPLPPGAELPEDFATGKTADSTLIRQAATAAVDSWRMAGHAKADIADQSLRALHDTSKLSAILRIEPGPKLTFGDTVVLSESTVRPGAIRRIAGVPKGETFSPEELRKAGQRLRRTGAFQSVTLTEADQIGPGDTIDTEIEVVDAKPRRFGFGAELSSLEGITVSGFWMHRNISGAADRLRLEAEARGISGDSGGIDYRLGLDYRYPAIYGADTDAFLTTNLEVLDEPDYRSEQGEIVIGASRILSDNLTAELGLGYRYSHVDDAFGAREFEILSAPFSLTWDTRDDLLNATEGAFVHAAARPFYETVRENTGLRFQLDSRAYRAFGETKSTVIAGRVQLGTVIGPSREATPPDYLFFSGGGGTVRGQGYQSLTIGTNGDATGGQSFAGVSLEARQMVRDKIQVVGFADYGWISAESSWQGEGKSHAGAGLGLRYITSFGPIRVDLATPVSGNKGGDIQLYIGIGQAF